MDENRLSERKYIFSVYKGGDDEIHVERFPVVYINKDYVYYIPSKGQRLVERDTDMVLSSVDRVIEKNRERGLPLYQGVCNHHYWHFSDNPDETIRLIRQSYKSRSGELEMARAKMRVEFLERQLNEAKEHLSMVMQSRRGV